MSHQKLKSNEQEEDDEEEQSFTAYDYEEDDEDDVPLADDDDDGGPRKLRKLNRTVSYKIHEVENVLETQHQAIDHVSELLGLDKHDAAVLLRHHKWDKEIACDAWWNAESSEIRHKIGLPPMPVEQVFCMSETEACMICQRIPIAASSVSDTSSHAYPPPPSSSSSSTTSNAKGIRAIHRDMASLTASSLLKEHVTVQLPDDDDLFTIHLLLKCGGMWQGMKHKFILKLPPNYPFTHPTIHVADSDRSFHPNIQVSDGSICSKLLTSEGWKSTCTLTDVVLSVQALFDQPDWDHALNHDALELYQRNKEEFLMKLVSLGAQPTEGKGAAAVDSSSSSSSSSSSNSSSRTSRNSEELKSTIDSKTSSSSSSSSSGISSSSSSSISNGAINGHFHETVALACGHHFCGECWIGTIEGAIDTGPDCLFLLCPAGQCRLVVPDALVSKYITDIDKLQRYRRFQLDSFVSQNKASSFCPAPGCHRVIEYPKRDNTRVITCDCGSTWCWGCRGEPHMPISCTLVDRWTETAERLLGKELSENWYAANVKTCSGCKKRIWKDGGCMHVTCKTKDGGCGTEFCWLCLGLWKEHSGATGGNYACNRYTQAASAGTLEGEAKQAFDAELIEKAHRKDVDRYQWHFDRYRFMQTSGLAAIERGLSTCTSQCAAALLAANPDPSSSSSSSSSATTSASATSASVTHGMIGSGERGMPPARTCRHGLIPGQQEKLERALEPILSKPPSVHQSATVSALTTANTALVICRQTLRYVYIAKYFIPENCPLVDIFQKNHDDFESHTEKLNRLIEKDWGLIAQKILDRREMEKKGDFGNFEELRENELLSLMPIVPPSVVSAVHLPAAVAQAAARGQALAAAGGAGGRNTVGAMTATSSLGSSASIFNVYGIADCGARTELTVTELYDQLRLLVLVTNDTLRFMESMCSASEFEAIFGF